MNQQFCLGMSQLHFRKPCLRGLEREHIPFGALCRTKFEGTLSTARPIRADEIETQDYRCALSNRGRRGRAG